MTSIYTGNMGAGKSYHAIKQIIYWLGEGRNVISTLNIDLDIVVKNMKRQQREKYKEFGSFTHVTNENLDTMLLINFALDNHTEEIEKQTLIVIDECLDIFDSRQWQRDDRYDWNKFFRDSRQLGFETILITQAIDDIDKRIRNIIEYHVNHRKVNNYGNIKFFPIPIFTANTTWLPTGQRMGRRWMLFKKKIGKSYNSYFRFKEYMQKYRPEVYYVMQ